MNVQAEPRRATSVTRKLSKEPSPVVKRKESDEILPKHLQQQLLSGCKCKICIDALHEIQINGDENLARDVYNENQTFKNFICETVLNLQEKRGEIPQVGLRLSSLSSIGFEKGLQTDS